ncbi:hypothetical protein [Amycolatopsis sp. NPDC051128]|uniref:hypothetical protein n=1 Tax=Amycolatopsis sp. NPDC051128 TaxID=3155412 RepID=UPI00342CAF93
MTVRPTTGERAPLTALLEELLKRIAADVPGALGAAISVHHRGSSAWPPPTGSRRRSSRPS